VTIHREANDVHVIRKNCVALLDVHGGIAPSFEFIFYRALLGGKMRDNENGKLGGVLMVILH